MADLLARQATPADVDEVVTTLALAFATDPVWGEWTFPDVDDRVPLLVAMWRPFVAAGVRRGSAWTTDDAGAMALWVPPGEPELDESEEALVEEALDRVCGPRASLVEEGFERFAAIRPRQPHWYLSMLATRPDHAGRGLGMSLVADRLRVLDRDGMPAHLESTNRANLGRYRAAGFEVSGAFDLPKGPTVDTMWRAARRDARPT